MAPDAAIAPGDSVSIGAVTGEPPGPTLWVVCFDFENKEVGPIPASEIRAAFAAGKFVWIDVDVQQVEDARRVVSSLELIAPEILEDALTRDPSTQLGRYDDYIHLVLSGCRLVGNKFDLERVDAVVGETFLLTLHKGQPVFLEAVRKAYRADFLRFAKSPSFLVYELWDHLIDNYLAVQKRFEQRVGQMQKALIGDVDERVFTDVSELTSDLLELRSVVLPARAVLTDLSTRKTIFITEATQQFLGNMAGTIERVLQDVLVARDILSGSLNLYMSMVSHRTNAVMKALTLMSAIFLPLAFVVGFFGQNFENLPGLNEWGKSDALMYVGLAVCAATPGFMWWLFKRNKWM